MEQIDWQFCSNVSSNIEQHGQEILWCLSNDLEAHNQHFSGIQKPCCEALSREVDGLQLDMTITAENGKQFVRLFSYWKLAPTSAFERRWVYTKLIKQMLEQFNLRRFQLRFSKNCSADALFLPNDLLGVMHHPRNGYPEGAIVRVFCDSSVKGSLNLARHQANVRFADGYRDWVNEDPEQLTSIEIGRRLKDFSSKHSCQFQELETEELVREKMNLLVAVGRASEVSPPRLFIVTANLSKSVKTKPLALVGKGITFDTGGINVKPYEGHVHCMRNDMGGAALLAHVFMSLITNGYDKPLVLAIPACENLVGSRAMRPGSVFVSRAGKSVQVEHTDAEGRLILADALSYVSQRFDPVQTISAATLTTSALRQFSNYFTAVHFATPAQQRRLEDVAELHGEKMTFWERFLPFGAGNKSQYADLTNMGRLPKDASVGGGSNLAAHFLKEFVPGALLHFDIFASTWNWSGDYPGCRAGATGALLNPLCDFLEHPFS